MFHPSVADTVSPVCGTKLREARGAVWHGTELWIREPGEIVPVAKALSACNRALDREFDDLPEKAFHNIGAVEQAVEKAKRIT